MKLTFMVVLGLLLLAPVGFTQVEAYGEVGAGAFLPIDGKAEFVLVTAGEIPISHDSLTGLMTVGRVTAYRLPGSKVVSGGDLTLMEKVPLGILGLYGGVGAGLAHIDEWETPIKLQLGMDFYKGFGCSLNLDYTPIGGGQPDTFMAYALLDLTPRLF